MRLASGLTRFAVACGLLLGRTALASNLLFFDASQTTNFVAAGVTSDTLSSQGYLFTLTRDKLFTGGIGLTNPIGRFLRIQWPEGLEAQAVTSGPNPGGAKITLSRQDHQPFGIVGFMAKLLANTAGAGGAFEVMPKLQGEDGLPDPLVLDATGTAGNVFTHVTPSLTGFDAYQFSLYVDFALVQLTIIDADPEPPQLTVTPANPGWLQLSWTSPDPGFVLEYAAEVPTASWQPVNATPALNGELYTVEVGISATQSFFRLRK